MPQMAPSDSIQHPYQFMHPWDKQSYLNSLISSPPPHSDTTDIADTDFDSDSSDDFWLGGSPHRSVGSLVTDSVSTASTPDDIRTPDSTGLTSFHFHLDENPVAGPTGPHLFRLSGDGPKQRSSPEIEFVPNSTPLSATTPRHHYAARLNPERKDTPVPENIIRQKGQVTRTTAEPIEATAASWTPQEVVTWLQKIGMDEGIVERFFVNDISGSVLLDLQPEDLKELEIHSFGKRHRLMTSIRQLRNSVLLPSHQCQNEARSVKSDPVAQDELPAPGSTTAIVGPSCTGSTIMDDEQPAIHSRQLGQRPCNRRRRPQLAIPEDSISIVAIEQLLPKLHTCSKGEDCRKWQKQQAKLARIVREFPGDSFGYGSSIAIRGDPGNAATAQSLVKTPKSDVTPSITASSDVLGPNQAAHYQLSEDKLNGVEPRDPQENVRNFINFQRLSRLQPVNDPSSPPGENSPSPQGDSPNSVRANASLSENLRHLPKLRIPSTHQSMSDSSANLSAQRTVTPSILNKKAPFTDQNTHGQEVSQNPYSSFFSPSEFYRQHPHYEQSTPVSEVDVPLTAIPPGPVERDFSQSVPPDMRFGSNQVARPSSTKAENHRRNVSFQNAPNARALRPWGKGEMLPPIETPEDLENTPRAAHCRGNRFTPRGQYANDITHSGWMKKRKTTRFLRREWEEHHFALRGTQLAMFPDEEASRRNSKALEHIDVDDYAVACSSLPSNSKLTAAFKKTVLKHNDNPNADTAFAFSLIPAPNLGADRKATVLSGPKSHHFAVKTRDERIDWMRELMLAKALKKGRDSGATLNVNGNMI